MNAARALFASAALLVLGCAAEETLARGARYLDDPAYRRTALEGSFVDPTNGYAELRLARYATPEGGWDALPAWDPPVRPVTLDDIGRFSSNPHRVSSPDEGTFAPVLGEGVEWSFDALLELGRRAFETYPVQLADTVGTGTRDAASVERYGLWVDERGRVGGLVRVALADGSERFAVTCATCHARPDEAGHAVHGPANHAFDWGALAHREALERGRPADEVAYLLEWGAGQVDVTPDGLHNAAAISDLRPVRHQRYLHWAGTLENDPVALAIRLETLMITSMRQSVRPPRELAFALALYVWELGRPGAPGDAAAHPEGAELFRRECAACHGADGSVARPRRLLDDIGTDPAVGLSSTRGTGYYRVPSLWRVGERGQLLHDGSLETLDELVDPGRLARVPGHEYGTDLAPSERAALVAFVRTIGRTRE